MRIFFCAYIGCVRKCSRLSGDQMFCGECWRVIPSDVQRLILKAYRAKFTIEGNWSEPFQNAMNWAHKEIYSLRTHGHRIPQQKDFMWND